MIFENYKWHESDQPTVLPKIEKKKLRAKNKLYFLKFAFTSIFYLLFFFLKYLFGFFVLKNNKKDDIDRSFYGLCVNLDKGSTQNELIEELGVNSLQIRFYLSDMNNIDKYVEFAKSFKSDKEILICVIQSRKHIENQALLQKDIKIVFEKFACVTNEFMIGSAINRIKWGFVNTKEYLEFYKTVFDIKNKLDKNIVLIGSGVIDFEFHFTISTLFNNYKIYFDKIASLLYVDRRGAPQNSQYLIFDLKQKINFLYEIVKSSKKSSNDIYITETNWPLKNTAPYAPTSEKECVSMDKYCEYMVDYFKIAKNTKKIKKVYWHQLISAGYGLVDNRNGEMIKTKAFYEFKNMIKSNKNDKK